MNVGKEIKRLRKAKKWSQERLALESGLTQAMISQLELGYAGYSDDSIRKIANALDVPVGIFFEDEDTDLFLK